MRPVFLVGLALAWASYAPCALAEAPSAAAIKKAADSFDIGRERFRSGKFTEAAERFEAADAAAPSAAALHLAMLARKEAGQRHRAATLAALAMQRHSNEAALTKDARKLLREVSGNLGKLRVVCDSPCELLLGRRLVHGAAAESRIIYVEPGEVELSASWSDDRSESESFSVEAGRGKEISFYAPALPDEEVPTDEVAFSAEEETEEEPQQQAEKRKGLPPGVFWTGFTLTATGAAATAILGVNATQSPGKQAVLDNCAPGDRDCDEFVKGRRNQTIANVALGGTAAVGVLTMITGIWLTDWGRKKEEKVEQEPQVDDVWGRLQVRPHISVSSGAVIGARGRF